MMRSTKSSTLFVVSPEDWSTWSQQLQSETERGLATTAAAILDHLLARLIEGFLINDPLATKKLLRGPFSPLGSFAARTAAAYSLGLISEEERDDLDTIRDIRNEFAHKPTSPSFSDKTIARKVKNLKIPKIVPSEIQNWATASLERLFTDTVSMLSTFIDIRTREKVDRRTHAKKFRI
jgi:DNA-binding MltR family transcriptional regulator